METNGLMREMMETSIERIQGLLEEKDRELFLAKAEIEGWQRVTGLSSPEQAESNWMVCLQTARLLAMWADAVNKSYPEVKKRLDSHPVVKSILDRLRNKEEYVLLRDFSWRANVSDDQL